MVVVEQVPAPPEGAPGKRTRGRAGRDLPAAIGVGLALGVGAVLVPVYVYPPAFLTVVVAAITVGTWELARAVRVGGVEPPLPPLLVGAVAMVVLGYVDGAGAMVSALLLTVVAGLLWRLADPRPGLLRDAAAGGLVAVYVPFLAGFAALLLAEPDGADRITVFIATVVCSDVGGFTTGVLAGRHPMAPSVSPKKSWEGFAGSLAACLVGGGLLVALLLDGPVWVGLALGAAVACSATLGDLGESMIKRDLGIKDMGTLLPGHGGLMDRLDSVLLTAPVAWVLLTGLVPA